MPRVAALRRKRDGATEWLRKLLRGCGPITTREIKEHAATHGVKWRTVERAGKELGVDKRPGGYQGSWVWCLPLEPQRLEGDHAA
jgi:hypothetical protein